MNCKYLRIFNLRGINKYRCVKLDKYINIKICDNCDGREHKILEELVDSAKAIAKEPKLASKELIAIRKKKCESCKHRKGRRCNICKCFLDIKIKFLATHCPIKIW